MCFPFDTGDTKLKNGAMMSGLFQYFERRNVVCGHDLGKPV